MGAAGGALTWPRTGRRGPGGAQQKVSSVTNSAPLRCRRGIPVLPAHNTPASGRLHPAACNSRASHTTATALDGPGAGRRRYRSRGDDRCTPRTTRRAVRCRRGIPVLARLITLQERAACNSRAPRTAATALDGPAGGVGRPSPKWRETAYATNKKRALRCRMGIPVLVPLIPPQERAACNRRAPRTAATAFDGSAGGVGRPSPKWRETAYTTNKKRAVPCTRALLVLVRPTAS
jgi:hypothetical protein